MEDKTLVLNLEDLSMLKIATLIKYDNKDVREQIYHHYPELENERILFLASYLDIAPRELIHMDTDDKEVSYGNKTYYVVTDTEANYLAYESVENYLDELIYDMEKSYFKQLIKYIDKDRFINDGLSEGRGHILASYDGYEDEQELFGERYYIYRIN